MKVSAGVYAILATQTLDAVATMIVLPTIPFFAMGLGADAFTISLIGSAYNCAQMLCSPALGALSDAAGRKTVMVLGLTGQAVCNGMLSFAGSVPELIAARVAVGVALSTGPVEMAYIMDAVSTEQDLSHVLALQRILTSAGALLGPLIARWLPDVPFQILVRGLVCVNMVNLLIGIVFWKDAPAKDGPLKVQPGFGLKEAAASWSVMRSMLTNHATASLLLVSWVYTLGYGIGDGPEVVFFKEHFGFGKDQTCDFFVVTNLSSLIFATVVPGLVEAGGPQCVCKLGCLGAAASVLSLIVFSGYDCIPYLYGAAMVGLCGSMIGVGYMHLVRQRCPEKLMGTMLGLQSCLNGFAGTVGPPTGGALYNWNNFVPYALTALFAAAAAGLYAALPAGSPAEAAPILGLPAETSLRRVSTFGKPIYPNKSFTTQVQLNALMLESDPELMALYKAYRAVVDRERGPAGGLHNVATVPGDLVSREAEAAIRHGTVLEAADLGRSDTYSDMTSRLDALG